MPAIASLLRAVNLGSHNQVKMDKLRELYLSLGLRNAQTYVQSGNVVFTPNVKDLDKLRKRIEKAIEQTFHLHIDVVLRSAADLEAIVKQNPFAKRAGVEGKKLVVHFLATEPDAEAREKITQVRVGPEELHLIGRNLYIHYSAGQGTTKLTPVLLQRTLKTLGTARNWNTVTKLLEMAKAIENS